MRVTIKDIAAKAGVSKTTVSFALNDPDRLSPETRRRVLEVVAELGYEPDSVARALARRRLDAIGLLLPQPLPEALGNPYLCELLRGIGAVCEERGLALTLLPPVLGKAEEAARRAAVDGVLSVGIEPGSEVERILGRRGLPYVTIDGVDPDPAAMRTIANIGIDDEGAARGVMGHLIALGHRRVGIIQLKPEAWASDNRHWSPVSLRRLAGFSSALGAAGIEVGSASAPLVLSESTFEGGLAAAADLLSLPESRRPTAIAAMSDIVALGAAAAAARLGLRVPASLSITGFDDIPLADRASPALTTVRQPGYDKGAAAAEAVLEIIDGSAPRSRYLPAELVVRGSSAPPAARPLPPAQRHQESAAGEVSA